MNKVMYTFTFFMIERTNSIFIAHFTMHILPILCKTFMSIVASLCMSTRCFSHFHQDWSKLSHFLYILKDSFKKKV